MHSSSQNISEIERTDYVFAWGEKYSTLLLDIIARIAIDHPDIISNDIPEYLNYVLDRNQVKGFYSLSAMDKIDREHGEYFLRQERIGKMMEDYDSLIDTYESLFSKINGTDPKQLSNDEIYSLLKEYIGLSEYGIALFRMTREEGETGPAERIRAVLRNHFEPERVEEAFRIITESANSDTINRERHEWLDLLQEPWNKEKALAYTLRFPATYMNLYDYKEILTILKNRYDGDIANIEQIKEELAEKSGHRKNIAQQQEDIFILCEHNHDLMAFAKMIQDFGVYRFKLKHYWAGAELRCLPFFQEICERMGVSLRDFFDLYLIEDMYSFFEKGVTLSDEEKISREKCIVIWVKDRQYRNFFGQEGHEVVAAIDRHDYSDVHELKGLIAYPGRLIGKVRIIHNTDMGQLASLSEGFAEGDILVSENTQPAMVVLMRKASAILTDQGGITSHAAIVSREFKKPCIVGLKLATKILKDGDMVEVDANVGIIRKMEE